MDWKNLVATVAPTIGGMLLGPQSALAIKLLAKTLLPEESSTAEENEARVAEVLTAGATPEVRMRLIELDAQLARQQHEEALASLRDIQDARARDAAMATRGTPNVRANWMLFASYAIVFALLYMVWKTAEIDEYTKGLVTLLLGRALGWIDQAQNFEWGTTRLSRAKDDTIDRLSRKE